jgi:hypothetical protein
MLSPLQPPSREIDVDLLVFLERYTPDLLKWDILSLFAKNPNFAGTAFKVAQSIGRAEQTVRPGLGDLVMHGVLESEQRGRDQVIYQLTRTPRLRKLVRRLR